MMTIEEYLRAEHLAAEGYIPVTRAVLIRDFGADALDDALARAEVAGCIQRVDTDFGEAWMYIEDGADFECDG